MCSSDLEERLFGDTDVQLFEVNAKSFREGIALQRLTSGRRKYATTARSAEYLTSYNVADARLTLRKTDRDINGNDTLRTGLTEERLHRWHEAEAYVFDVRIGVGDHPSAIASIHAVQI